MSKLSCELILAESIVTLGAKLTDARQNAMYAAYSIYYSSPEDPALEGWG